ncbi:WD40 repeat-like protein [Trichodelitschia bisporula]|uniref:WD40 repeat-like protein n=1 Tax=Trichodelitschia bisporula TaxID=703511 RepID=A0A6G1I4M2_9PEZI|nr:WD40 repeat-like protein [Trichodelitschia bisporula]
MGLRLGKGATDASLPRARHWEDSLLAGQQAAGVIPDTGEPFYVAFSPDGKQLASGPYHGDIELWDTGSGKMLHTLRPKWHIDNLLRAPFSPDSKQLATVSSDTYEPFRVVFSPDGKQLASGPSHGGIKLWDTGSGKVLHTLSSNGGIHRSLRAAPFSPHGRHLATVSYYEGITVWDTGSRKVLQKMKADADEPFDVVFSPDDRIYAKL